MTVWKRGAVWLGALAAAGALEAGAFEPLMSIRANGCHRHLALATDGILLLDASIETNESCAGVNADWWLLADTPAGWWHYDAGAHCWAPGWAVSLQGPLTTVLPTPVYSNSAPPAGTYRFYFGVDPTMDGVVGADIRYDTVRVDALIHVPPLERLASNRPRLFMSAADAPEAVRFARERYPALLEQWRAGADAVTDVPPCADFGVESSIAAFLHLCDGTPRYLDLARDYLLSSCRHYRDCERRRVQVNWYAFGRIQAIAAYDWLYDRLDPGDRQSIGADLVAHAAAIQFGSGADAPDDNFGDHRSGFYGGPACLPWFAGIALHGAGIDDETASWALAVGYDRHIRMLEFRRSCAGDDGGSCTPTLGYALAANPFAEFNFFHTMASAFALDVATNWPHAALLPEYVRWNALPGAREFGAGDAAHTLNELPMHHLSNHLAHVRHFFGAAAPEAAALAAWEQLFCPPPEEAFPTQRFLLRNVDASPPAEPPDDAPRARHFEGMGQVFMRSGTGDGDTYALFTAGGRCEVHKQFDENTFSIYRGGFLALDTGTRPEPGSHLFQYYCRTIAHNGILIHMEGETMTPYWGDPAPGEDPDAPIANDGGMRSATGATVLAFGTTPTHTYIASDATACYHPDKCAMALRQFVHIQPRYFAVFDHVVSRHAQYRKTWTLHTAREPRSGIGWFSADQGDGRLFCSTLLPAGAIRQFVGGPGAEFMSGGVNWPLSPDGALPQTELMGAWRVELRPALPATVDQFLHFLETASTGQTSRTFVKLVQKDSHVALQFASGPGTNVTVAFDAAGEAGGWIQFATGTGTNRTAFPRSVEPQAGVLVQPGNW